MDDKELEIKRLIAETEGLRKENERLTAENERLKRCVDEQYKTLAEIKDTLTEYPTTSQEESTAAAVKKLCSESDCLNKMVGELEALRVDAIELTEVCFKEDIQSIIEKYKDK